MGQQKQVAKMIDRTGDTYSNGQGDIVKLIDGNGTTVVEYTWGYY